jgi:ABC-type polysaccharide/polyol phosphate export permease
MILYLTLCIKLFTHTCETLFFKVIKETVETRWSGIDYFTHVLLVITVPAEFSEKSNAIMRMCAYNAGLIKEKDSTNLQFTTERMCYDLFRLLILTFIYLFIYLFIF